MNGESDVCFEVAAEAWLQGAQTRDRKPLRASSVPTIRCALDNYLIPTLGKLPLSKVHNGTVKNVVSVMKKKGLSPKTVQTYTNMVKTIVASVLDEETGEPVFMRKWNPVVLDMPIVEDQHQPCFTAEEIQSMCSSIRDEHPKSLWEIVLYVLLASTGLRISEALGLEKHHVINGGRTLVIEQQVSRFGRIVREKLGTKTRAGKRQVDLHPDVAGILWDYMQYEVRNSLLFPTRENTPQLPRNILRNLTRRIKGKGFHAFRRFRESWLSEMSCNNDIKIFWMGHKPESMSELYSKLGKKTEMRLAEAERIGTGIDLHQCQIHPSSDARKFVSQIVKVA
jgi:integrase